MLKKIITLMVLACFLLYTGCASIISNVQVYDSEYDKILKVEKVFITTKDGKRYEVVKFKFTETHLVGQEIRGRATAEPIQISLSDIDLIEIKGVRDDLGRIITYEEIKPYIMERYTDRSVMAILGVIGFGALGFVPINSLALVMDEKSDALAMVLFLSLEIGMMVLGGHLGYKGVKNSDIRKAIKNIQNERDKNYTRPLKEKDEIIIISDLVGEVIDLEERNKYGLFPYIEGFQSAILIKEPDGKYAFKVTYQDETSDEEKVKSIYQKESLIYQIRARIENF